jgi:sialate O-acetylesterase
MSGRLLNRIRLLPFVLTFFCSLAAFAQPTGPQPWWPVQPRELPFVHPLFSNDMVLQREIAAPIWGWSTPSDDISVKVDGKPTGRVAKAGSDGRWTMKIGPFPPGGPHTIVVEGKAQKVTITNVLFGDVWLCTGQSNMNWPVRLANNADEEVKQANYPEIRSFTVSFYSSLVPLKLPPPAKWEACTPEFARNFTAVGYFFAREIHKTQKIPIGIIHSSAGATAAEAWTSADALRAQMPFDFPERLAELKQLADVGGPNFDFFRETEKWMAKVDPTSAARRYISDPNLNIDDWVDIAVPKPWQEAGLKDFHGLVWFRHSIDIPESWNGKDLSLILSVINDVDVVWFNGTLIGSKLIPGSTRTYDIDAKLVRPGKNLLVAAIVNKTGPGGFCSGPANMVIRPTTANPGEKPVRLSGTWKAKAAVRFEDLTVPFPTPQVSHYKMISSLFNGMIAPLTPFAIKGALWYQGEANGPFWLQYRRLLPTLIADWRARFEVGDFPFLIVSLANLGKEQTNPIEPGWAEIRESQWRTTRIVPNTGLAMTVDIGDPNNIHPRNKQEVGRRLSLVARHLVYGEKDLVYSGPEFTEMQIELPKGDKIRLYFKNIGSGLCIKPGEAKLTGFAIAGVDKQFVWADAVIEGNTIVVSSPDCFEPKYVRYGWAWNPVCNLYNKDGLPAITFRTDE